MPNRLILPALLCITIAVHAAPSLANTQQPYAIISPTVVAAIPNRGQTPDARRFLQQAEPFEHLLRTTPHPLGTASTPKAPPPTDSGHPRIRASSQSAISTPC